MTDGKFSFHFPQKPRAFDMYCVCGLCFVFIFSYIDSFILIFDCSCVLAMYVYTFMGPNARVCHSCVYVIAIFSVKCLCCFGV